jgi:large subunit ribosomal protein L30
MNLKITLIRSTIGSIPKHRKTVQAMGLKKINGFVVRENSPAVWGMINQVRHLVKVEEV